MSTYQKINNITGWFIFLIATIVYVVAIEPTASFWDCGEFIAVSYKLMVPHPPGAPFFLLIGRLFSLFASDVTQVAFWVNMVSALSSSLTILFLFWSITLLARKLVVFNDEPTLGQTIAIIGSGIIGSLAFTFSDSFWFSAEEAEVYAMSSFFTAFVFWAILKWESKYDEEDSEKWLILIAYMVGLSIGVHLLNLVALPALAFVYYFKKYPETTTKGVVVTFIISGIIIMTILVGIIPGLPSLAGKFEIFFVNNLGTPFGGGIIFFSILLIGALTYGIFYSIKKEKQILNTALLCLTFILIGYSSYGIILIRSNFNPPIDENDPENIISFVSYLKREQYGDRPLFKGPLFTAGYPIDAEQGDPIYVRDDKKGEYVIADYKMNYIYDPKHVTLLPRAYSTQPHHIEAYKERMNLREGKKPTFWQDKEYMLNYQIGHMFLRYFMWNFAGRESDIQDAGWLKPWDSKKGLPEALANNKARNNYYMLPFILGILGLIFQFSKNRKDASVVGLLFFFTGIAIVLYLNQPPVEPRERDYTFAGAYYAFAIWIGLGVMFIADLLEKIIKNEVARPAIATIVCLLVPGIMAAENWDDHDRSGRYHSVDSAKNLLNSCAPNAVLFTGGDNDTFPLWYVQEVEGFRTDVRVCNLSLLNTDWYIQQMKQQAYNSDPLPISLDYKDFMQGKNDQVYYSENPRLKNGIDLAQYIQLVRDDNPIIKQETRGGEAVTILPSKNLILPINKEEVLKANVIPEDLKGFVLDKLAWDINAGSLEKKDLIMLDMIVTNKWKRPIYFSTTLSSSNFLNLKEYTQLEGLAHRLLPVKVPGATQGWINTDTMYRNMMKKYYWRGLDNPKVYYDENYLRFPINARSQFYRLASQLVNEGKNDKAKEVVLYSLKVMPDKAIPYDMVTPPYISLLLKLGEEKKAMEISEVMGNRAHEYIQYLAKQKVPYNRDYELNFYILDQISRALKEAGKNKEADKYEKWLMEYSSQFSQ